MPKYLSTQNTTPSYASNTKSYTHRNFNNNNNNTINFNSSKKEASRSRTPKRL